jgi:hypothetical protein
MIPENRPRPRRSPLRDNGLSIALLSCFLLLWGLQAVAGHRVWLDELRAHGDPVERSLGAYLSSPHFWQATSENWESEFLQMAVYVVFTIFLFQRGSSESKDPDEREAKVDRKPDPARPGAPAVLRRGGLGARLYSHSLTLAFLVLFLGAFVTHGVSGALEHDEEQRLHRTEPSHRERPYVFSSKFWFESLQNWQSEFLAVLSMVILSIHLRQRGSPESKPVDAAHDQTGAE